MSDLVSRQAVLDMLQDMRNKNARSAGFTAGTVTQLFVERMLLEKIAEVKDWPVKSEKRSWNYVEKVGNPTQEGQYIVTLIYDERENYEETGKKKAFTDMRWFGDADKDPDLKNWKMCDQPDYGLIWTEQTGSCWHEHVHAWIKPDEVLIADLPEGVEGFHT